MGLRRSEVMPNGVQVRYHRVASITHYVGQNTLVEVQSYTSQAKRREQAAPDGAAGGVYVEVRSYEHPYDDALTVADAYAWLKGLPDFEGAEDVLEGD